MTDTTFESLIAQISKEVPSEELPTFRDNIDTARSIAEEWKGKEAQPIEKTMKEALRIGARRDCTRAITSNCSVSRQRAKEISKLLVPEM